MTSRFYELLAVATLALSLPAGCAGFERGAASPDSGASDGATATVSGPQSFATDVHPILISGCQTCHSAGGAAGDTTYLLTGDATTDLGVVTALVDAASPAMSRLLTKASGQGHGGGAIYAEGTPEYQTLLAWIAGGTNP